MLTLLHFNDVYNIQERQTNPVGGASRFATVVKQHENALVLFSGDAFNPSVFSTAFKGRHMVPVLNELGIKVACYGNHDFDFGIEDLILLTKETSFPWLITNVKSKSTLEPIAAGEISKVIHLSGKKIAFIGLVEHEWLETLAAVDESELVYEDYVECARRITNELLSAGADLVIALT